MAYCVNRSTRNFHQCLGWAENRGLSTNFRASSYVLPAGPSAWDRKLRPFGRRLVASGAPGRCDWRIGLATCSCGNSPNAIQSVWPPVCCRGRHSDYRSSAKRVFRYALRCPCSWAHAAGANRFWVVPGGHTAQRRWKQLVVQPLLQSAARSQYVCLAKVAPSSFLRDSFGDCMGM